jgi:DNA-binding winged helix-turn-helix (wHTH) protein
MMVSSGYRFDDYTLDVTGRQLLRGNEPIELNGRYFDALVLLVREHGQLIGKDRFFTEVWGDVIVSDSALSQCIKEIRRQLGDDAGTPRYVQTVPRYGYRFIGKVEPIHSDPPPAITADQKTSGTVQLPVTPAPSAQIGKWPVAMVQGVAGTLGGGVAGVIGGVFYGSTLAYASVDPGVGAASVLLVMVSLSAIIGLAGGLGVAGGMALSVGMMRGRVAFNIVGAALGGMLVGGVAKLLGMDAFNLLFGHAPSRITGALEGLVLGAALATGAQLAGGITDRSTWRPVLGAGVAGAVAGVLIPFFGGNLLAGSLDLLRRSFVDSRLRVDALGDLFGDGGFGTTTHLILGGVEGMLFGSCVVGAFVLAQRTTWRE